MFKDTNRKAMLLALAAVLLWSTVATGFKLGLARFEVVQLLWLGVIVSWLIFACHAAFTGALRLPREHWLWVIVLGLINPAAYYLILFEAYDRLPAHIAQPLNYTWAITLALLAVPILGQRLGVRRLVGIVISYAGVVMLLSSAGDSADHSVGAIGVFLALFSTLLWASYWLLTTRLTVAGSGLMFWSFSAALPCVTLACLLGPGLPALGTDAIVYGGWVGAIEMGVTYLLWQRALSLADNAASIAQLIFLSPFLSLLLIHLVLGEAIASGAIAGLGLIVAGLIVSREMPERVNP